MSSANAVYGGFARIALPLLIARAEPNAGTKTGPRITATVAPKTKALEGKEKVKYRMSPNEERFYEEKKLLEDGGSLEDFARLRGSGFSDASSRGSDGAAVPPRLVPPPAAPPAAETGGKQQTKGARGATGESRKKEKKKPRTEEEQAARALKKERKKKMKDLADEGVLAEDEMARARR